ncbi:hypothetical protein [Celeribacter indicus]|uniref:Uncharacterized protein n=1 Tax=Celeribacter indicus TaxID=1208324 RepID=A0A0B5E6M5_9RHOB|nr:hypothetical protein [Celeribacter indicus]AJE47967.1 hypothetical protein P73_3252 [Celeribacter indicus]SDW28260.1 hypothetical protein SAMN05443573_102242 [Celeribacter indicus]
MTARILLSSVVLAGLLALQSALPANAWGGDDAMAPTFFVVIENGGVVTDPESQMEAARSTLGELTDLRRRRATKHSTIHIITSANPTEITWSGTPEQLYAQGAEVIEAIQVRPTCSDLTLAWQEVRNNVRISRPDDLRLIGIGPFIHAGYPCDDGDGLITLPQAVPVEVQLGSLAMDASFLRLLNVHADQDEMALEHLESAGALDRVTSGALDFDLMDNARTRSNLGNILGRD